MDGQFDRLYSVLKAGEIITTWAGVQGVVRAGLAHNFFSVGDQLVAKYGGEPTVWDIIGIDHDIPTDTDFRHSLTIQANGCLQNAQFSAPQALWYAKEELPAGDQIFTQDNSDLKYKFTTTKPVPVGGQVFHNFSEDYIPGVATTYAADRVTVIESGLPITEVASGGDTLADINVRTRVRYGSNTYHESAIKQWLNSEDEVFQWEPKANFDRPSTYTGTAGFLYRLDPELVAVIGAVNKQVALNTVVHKDKQVLFSDRVFLLSRVEVGFTTEGTTTGEKVYDYYNGINDEGRIKLLPTGSARTWWLRSPCTGGAYYVRSVFTSGELSSNGALNSYGAAPACCIV